MKEDMSFSFASNNGGKTSMKQQFEYSSNSNVSSNDKVEEAKTDAGENKATLTIELKNIDYWMHIMSSLLTFSTILFVSSVSFVIRLLSNNNLNKIIEIGILLFSIALLILSVIVKLRTDDSKWIKRSVQKTLIKNIGAKNWDKNELKLIRDILEME